MNPNYLFVGTLFLAGLLTFAAGILELVGAIRSRSWPSVVGVVSKSRLVSVVNRRSNVTVTTWKPEILYTFTFNGAALKGNIVAFGLDGLSMSKAWAASYVDRYPVGRQISVFVDPNDTSSSVLEPGPTFKATTSTAIGMVFLVLASWFALRL
jgi:hypothetical protein